LSPADIATPIRRIVRNQPNAKVMLGHIEGIDRRARTVRLRETARPIPYDVLVVATGAGHAYFGHEDWEKFAPGLKLVEDALDIRNHMLDAFERAERVEDAGERQRMLSFAIIGGGPTGVEVAGAIAELARIELAQASRALHGLAPRVVLIEAGPQILPTFAPPLAAKARHSLEQLGVEVRTNSRVERCDAEGVIAAGERIQANTLVWAAGVAASPAAQWLQVEPDRAGRVPVNNKLMLADDPRVFVIGDTAAVAWEDGKLVPGIAPAAKQEGQYVARLLLRRIQETGEIQAAGGGRLEPGFRYHHAGDLATIGHKAAVVDFGWIRLSGLPAWLLWGIVHIFFLIGFRNRLVVMVGWLWSYFTSDRGARLITGTGRDL
jgi:NADH dehydrogenase